MYSKTKIPAILGFLAAATLLAQDAPLAKSSVNINLPPDSPVVLLKSNDSSRTTARGAAVLVDVDIALTLRNTSTSRIHGITLRVVAQEVAPAGVGSVFQPGLNVGPGEAFPVHIATKLMRPATMQGTPAIQVNLDGVLFQDLSFYGEDRLHSKRVMTVAELEAQRDRTALKRLLADGGQERLRQGVLKILARQHSLPQVQGTVRAAGITNAAVAAITPPEHQEKFAFLQFPDSPVELRQGSTLIAGSEARAPSVEVYNRSDKPVKYVELGWVLTDPAGQSYMAGSLPSTDPAFTVAPKSAGTIRQDRTMAFSTNGKPLPIGKVTSFVSQVEFADGRVWIPNRENLDSKPLLTQVLEPSAEEARLAYLYATKGLPALVDELKKY